MQQTLTEYRAIIHTCKELFAKKNHDYGTSWRILRLPSITDQIFIKAQRIRTLQTNGFSKVQEGEIPEFVGIINYAVMALILGNQDTLTEDTELSILTNWYDQEVEEVIHLLFNKNHDYGEAWRDMRVSSMTDIILMKLLRIKQIEDNLGLTTVSEGIRSGYQDIINYAVFCLIKLNSIPT